MSSKVIRVGIADVKVAASPRVLVSQALGSCVAIILYDSQQRVGALAHVMLPTSAEVEDKSNPAKFADTALETMLDKMRELGAKKERLVAKLAGGACMFSEWGSGSNCIGTRNVEVARRLLCRKGIRLVAEDTGGKEGRSVELHTATGRVVIRSVLKGEKEL